MAETVQNVFDDLLDSYKDLYSCDEFSYPGVADLEAAEYRERFAAALAAEKGSKSTCLADKQKNCRYCPMCGRRLEGK
jgi:NADH pyrophosphatase NudC (nudix superfamily)